MARRAMGLVTTCIRPGAFGPTGLMLMQPVLLLKGRKALAIGPTIGYNRAYWPY